MSDAILNNPNSDEEKIVKRKEIVALFIPVEEALELKDLGFNSNCFGFYKKTITYYDLEISSLMGCVLSSLFERPSDSVLAPTYQQALKFFRDKGFLYCINPSSTYNKYQVGFLFKSGWELIKDIDGKNEIYTYEEAEKSCLKKLIELQKIKNWIE